MRVAAPALLLPVLPLLALTMACKPEVPKATGEAPTTATAPAPPAPPGPAAPARKLHEANSLFEFDYSYPAAAAAIPGLRDWLEADIAKQRTQLASDASEGKQAAAGGTYPFNPYSLGVTWQVVTDLPGWLSLSAALDDYSGGAHPNHGFAALLWDRQANRRREPIELFTSKAALSAAIRPAFCDQIDKQRAERRGAPVNRASGDIYDACLDPTDEVVILGSGNHRTFDRIGVLVKPYDAGPYVEGGYEATVPVNAAVLAAVKPEYRAAFSIGR